MPAGSRASIGLRMNQQQLNDAWPLIEEADKPGYLYSIASLRTAWQSLRSAIPLSAGIYYSLKANPHPVLVDHLYRWGADMDVCSLGELRTVLDAGVSPGSISYLGPGKTDAELSACIEHGVGTVVAESIRELQRLSLIAEAGGREINVILRVNPREAASGSRLAMGGRARQFGIDEEQLLELRPRDVEYPGVRVTGFHSYNGTRNLDAGAIVSTTARLLDIFEALASHLDVPLLQANVGGGFGIAYHESESDLDLAALADGLEAISDGFSAARPESRLHFESGRFIAGPSATYMTRIVDKKRSRDTTFLVCDGGTNQFLAASGGGSPMRRNFPARVITPEGHIRAGETEHVDVSGPLCTPTDILLKNADLPVANIGDRIAIGMAGAYGASASPVDFLSHEHPFAIFLEEE
jgi:diaminopimelate decarboxylase